MKIAPEKGYTVGQVFSNYSRPHYLLLGTTSSRRLRGADVARKLTILARLIPELADSLPRGYLSVDTKSLVPEVLATETNGDAFMHKLPAHDGYFEQMRLEAAKEGKVLRYVGVIDVANGIIKASLEK